MLNYSVINIFYKGIERIEKRDIKEKDHIVGGFNIKLSN